MKLIYHLSINADKGERQRWLSVCYLDGQKAYAELRRWADKFRKEWQVPEKSDAHWDLCERFNSERTITFMNRTKENRCRFYGHLDEECLIEEGEHVASLCGEVFAVTDNPDILFTNSTPITDNNTSFTGNEPINMATRERCDFPDTTGNLIFPDEERATEYYNLRSKLIDGELRKSFSK